MKIGLIVYEPLEDQSGGYFYDRKVMDCLRRRGHEVVVYTFPFEVAKVVGDEIKLLFEDELCHVDLIDFNLRLKEKFPIPIITIVHHLRYLEPIPQPESEREKEEKFLRFCDAVIANSAATSEEIRKLGIDLPTLIAKPGCNHLPLPPDFRGRATQSPLKLLSVGNLIPRKGFHLLLEALEGLGEFPWRLCIVGDEMIDTVYVESLKMKAQGFGSKVQFLGKVPPEELSQLYLNSDLFILPSYFEGFGIVITEAIFHFLPVIATRVGGIPEIVRDGREGLLIAPGENSPPYGRGAGGGSFPSVPLIG
jgi:glycosyltransferase involved in cell wall biosynthesis